MNSIISYERLNPSTINGEQLRVTISYERLNPSTINREQLRVTITYSSFIKDEIDSIESFYKKVVETMRIDNSGGDE